MSKRLPFEILTTAAILAAPYPESQPLVSIPSPVYSITSSSINTIKPKTVKYLDEVQGKKILTLIYERGGTIEKSGKRETTTPSKKKQSHQSSFYVPNNNQEKEQKGEEKGGGLDILDKMSDYFHIESNRLLKYIDLDLLVENAITLDDLLRRCDVAITDLVATGIVQGVDDLCALKFKMTDLVINEQLFRVQHLPDLFQLTYPQLRKMKNIRFSALDIIECQFYPNELAQLGFSFDHLINDKGLNVKQLECLNFSLADLISLNLTVENLQTLGITSRIALDVLNWDPQEYATFVGKPVLHNTRKMNKMM